MIDIFESNIREKMTETCYIVASGPNGADFHSRVPSDCFTIAVNGAIEADISPDLWMCADLNVRKTDYFAPAYEKHADIACFGTGLSTVYSKQAYTFNYGSMLCNSNSNEIAEFARGATSIAGQAVQAAHRLGAKRIILVGVDMAGIGYFDGSQAQDAVGDSKNWKPCIKLFNALIKWLGEQGCIVESLSETALDVEVIDHGSGRPAYSNSNGASDESAQAIYQFE